LRRKRQETANVEKELRTTLDLGDIKLLKKIAAVFMSVGFAPGGTV
jgi:hypothetical protein